MKINKIIPGFVVQTFDTETRKFVSQGFVGSDDHTWEDRDGRELGDSNEDLELIYGKGGVDEPELYTHLVQPNR
jgi:hypothetical protein